MLEEFSGLEFSDSNERHNRSSVLSQNPKLSYPLSGVEHLYSNKEKSIMGLLVYSVFI